MSRLAPPHVGIAPSPISSDTGTHFTDMDDPKDTSTRLPQMIPEARTEASPVSAGSTKIKSTLTVTPVAQSRSDEDKHPISAIYAPIRASSLSNTKSSSTNMVEGDSSGKHNPPNRTLSETSVSSRTTATRNTEKNHDPSTLPTTLQTELPSTKDWAKTPRAQTRHEIIAPARAQSKLASIVEGQDSPSGYDQSENEGDPDPPPTAMFRNALDELQALDKALSECWVLCNTLASLSNVHRERTIGSNMQQRTWTTCWKFCQNLYEDRNNATATNVRHTLDLCREFCQALFNARIRDNEIADSILRVSFELNNHLFNTHDRGMLDAVTQRTLDFYVTLCHRLMKQKASVDEDNDALLKACWSLAEMLFSLQQSKREGRQISEELLSSAVQACWDLCHLFQDGWKQIRPERQTPRPSQPTLTQALQQAKQTEQTRTESARPEPSRPPPVFSNMLSSKITAETPTTIFSEGDGSNDSPYEAPTQNIMVLGSDADATSRPSSVASARSITASSQTGSTARQSIYRWPSTSSAASYTSSTPSLSINPQATTRTPSTYSSRSPQTEERALLMLKSLFVRAAIATNRGYSVERPNITLSQFVKSLPDNAFGAQVWQTNLLEQYRKIVLTDSTFEGLGRSVDPKLIDVSMSNPATSFKVREEVAQAVSSMISSASGWTWLKDLYRFSFGIHIDEVLDDISRPSTMSSTLRNTTPRAEPRRTSLLQSASASPHSRHGSGSSIASNSVERMQSMRHDS